MFQKLVGLLPSGPARTYVVVAASVLGAALAVLSLIPGNQGEALIQKAIEILNGLLA